MSPQLAVDSRTDRNERGLSETPILWIPFLCIQSDRPTRVGEGVSWKGTSLELWFPCWLTRFVTGEARRTFRLRRTYAVCTRDVRRAYAGRGVPTGHPQEVGLLFQQSLSLGLSKSVGRYRCFLRLSDCPRVAASLNPQRDPIKCSLRKLESHRQSHSKL